MELYTETKQRKNDERCALSFSDLDESTNTLFLLRLLVGSFSQYIYFSVYVGTLYTGIGSHKLSLITS